MWTLGGPSWVLMGGRRAQHFERVGLHTNMSNTKEMVCMLGFIWVQQGFYVYKGRATGEGSTFW